jgi:hypothetical protein
MKLYLLFIFSLVCTLLNAQIEDHFDDGDFISSPAWEGNGADFNVNADFQLQLNATSAGNSYLSVPANLSSLDSVEWHFFIRLTFSPSSSNYSSVYLSSDQSDLTQPLNGYFLQFGEALSSDAIELFRQDGTTLTSICRGTAGNIAAAFSAGVKVTRSSTGVWTLLTDYNGGTQYTLEATGFDVTYNMATFIGLNCLYTSGNITKFYFDDFYAGLIISDTIKPIITSIKAVSNTILSVLFSEEMDSASIVNTINYDVNNGIGHPYLIEQDTADPLKFFLAFTTQFPPGIELSIHITSINDDYQNQMNDADIPFTYIPILNASFNDIIFSEIYFENSSLSPLPNAEYVEILNRRDSAISLKDWQINDGNTSGKIHDLQLSPHSYALLFSENDSAEFPGREGIHSFPTLNNDVGDHLTLTDDAGELITQLTFNNDLYHDTHKDDGGWSLERIDVNFTCDNDLNWKASVANEHGTPGIVNSVYGIFKDDVSPLVQNAFISDSNNVMVFFSEDISDGLNDINNYRLRDPIGNFIQPSFVEVINQSNIKLKFNPPFIDGIYLLEVSNTLHDCPGNELQQNNPVKIGYAEEAVQGDIIINELLFNPISGGNDFVEIYNCSNKNIDLLKWAIQEKDYDDSTDVKDEASVTSGHKIIFPGEFLVLTENDKKVKSFYHCENPDAFLDISGMPDFNSDKGRVVLNDSKGNCIDAFKYTEEIHFPLLNDTKGISLERMSFFQETNDVNNWHSAAATAGFATPGYNNSQRIDSLESGNEITIGVEIFSPDNDGYNDVLPVYYQFPYPGTVLSLNIFDCNGQSIRKLIDGETVSNEGVICWDGLKDNHTIASSGVYILLAKSFDLDGRTKAIKRVCYLIRKH